MRVHIPEKVLQDLEFTTVLEQVADYCITSLGKDKISTTIPFTNKGKLLKELKATNEYLSSFISENRIPNHYFENILEDLKRLAIENSYIEPQSFINIATTTETIGDLQRFFTKFKTYFPTLSEFIDAVDFEKNIITEIKKVVSNYGEIIDTASPVLKQIRKEKHTVQGKIGQSFTSALERAKASGYLDDIRESVVDNHRVIAVLAMYRKKVKGSLMGSSKSGNIVYIAPQATLGYQRELQNLVYEEKQEIIRILRKLSEEIRPYTELLESYINYLTHLDTIGAKAKYAHALDAVLPKINRDKKVNFKDAYHPLLLVKKQRIKIRNHTPDHSADA